MKIDGVYILSRRSIARMLATISAALMMLYAAATAPVEDMVRRIHDVAGGLLSLDRQMVGRLMRTVVPDILYLEYKSLYLEVKASGAAARVDARPPGAAVAGRAARRDASPHHGRVALLRDRRNAARTVGARASAYWRLHEKTMERDAKRTGEKRGFSCAKTLASAYRKS